MTRRAELPVCRPASPARELAAEMAAWFASVAELARTDSAAANELLAACWHHLANVAPQMENQLSGTLLER